MSNRVAEVSHDGGKAAFSVVEKVCLAHFSGVLSAELYRQTMAKLAELIETYSCGAAVVDFHKSVMALTPRDMHSVRKHATKKMTYYMRIPIAVICSPPTEQRMRELLWDSARNGFERVVFSEPLAAWAWALKRAREVRQLRQDAMDRGWNLSMPDEQ